MNWRIFNMRFNTEQDAYEYWEECYYLSGGGYEGIGVNCDGRVTMFKDWVDDQGVTWLDEDMAEWLRKEDTLRFSNDNI